MQKAASAGVSSDASNRLKLERAWSEAAASRNLSAEDYANWSQMRSTHRVMVTKGSALVAWRLFDGERTGHHRLIVTNFSCGMLHGSTASLRDGEGKVYTIDHTPRRILPNIFMWIPRYSDISFAPVLSSNAPMVRFSLVFKMLANPSTQEEGVLYLSEESFFHSMLKES